MLMSLRALAPALGVSALAGAAGYHATTTNKATFRERVAEIFPVAHTEAVAASNGVSRTSEATGSAPYDWDWDRRNSLPAGTGSRTLYLIRHGQYRNPTDDFPDTAQGLTDLGRKQALETGKRLAALTAGKTVKAIHCSTMLRARETAELISESFPGVPVLPNDLLREGAPCRPEPDTWHPREHTVFADSPRIEAAFRFFFYRAGPPETQEAAASGTGAIAPNKDGGKAGGALLPTTSSPVSPSSVEILVCHGNVIRFLALRALQLPPQAWLRLAVNNGSITTVTVRPNGGVSLSGLGECGHFKAEDVTYS